MGPGRLGRGHAKGSFLGAAGSRWLIMNTLWILQFSGICKQYASQPICSMILKGPTHWRPSLWLVADRMEYPLCKCRYTISPTKNEVGFLPWSSYHCLDI